MPGALAATINVSSISALQSAINTAAIGDIIVLADGRYTNNTISIPSGKNGIAVKSATPGGVYLTGADAITINGNNNTFSGFQFNSNSSGNIVIVVSGSSNLVTQLNFDGVNATKYIHLNTPGLNNVVSYCNFRNKPTSAPAGNLIHVSAQPSTPGYHKIRYCSFLDMPGAGGDNGNECIRLENGAQSAYLGRTVVEFCYFNNTGPGDSEAISFKCRENVVRYCTMTNNQNAQFVFRNGNDNVAYGNFFMGAGGFRVKEASGIHLYNNYFQNSGVGGINGCIKYNPSSGGEARVHFIHNTVVNSGVIDLGGASANYWANNIFAYASGDIFSGSVSGITFASNVYLATLGLAISSGMRNINPQLVRNGDGWLGLASNSPCIDAAGTNWPALLDIANVDDDPAIALDISGQSRPAGRILKDVGCDEYGVNATFRPLALSDVGPSYLGGPSGDCSAPAITAHPANQTAFAGLTATFTVSATGTGLTYQWQLSVSGGGFTNLSSATNSSYAASPAVMSDTGNRYRCVVTGTCGAAATSAATLTVSALPLNVSKLAGGQVQLSFATAAGVSYSVQASSNLTDWSPLTTLTNTNGLCQLIDPAATNLPRRFYRITLP